VPYPNVTIHIRNEKGKVAAVEEIGEIWVSSPYICESVASITAQNAEPAGPCVSVGEMGWRDTSGNLFLAGRQARMVTVLDQNVFCEEVEITLLSHPDVTGAAVVGVADQKRGHRLVAFLSGENLEPEALRAMSLARLGAVKTPAKYVVLDQFPTLAAGKADIQTLTQLAETL